MVKVIEETLYRWQTEGWTLQASEHGQYTLVHPRARPVIVGLRTSFQTVGTVQGEMRRALRDGARPQPVQIMPPATTDAPPPRRAKKKPKAINPGSGHFAMDDVSPPKPFFRPARRVQHAPVPPSRQAPPRRSTAFENAAWELAYLNLKLIGAEPRLIDIMQHRYRTDAAYREQKIDQFRSTPQAHIEALRLRVTET